MRNRGKAVNHALRVGKNPSKDYQERTWKKGHLKSHGHMNGQKKKEEKNPRGEQWGHVY